MVEHRPKVIIMDRYYSGKDIINPIGIASINNANSRESRPHILYLIVAKSGCGKDYISDKLCKDYGLKKVISRTTRKPRYEGEDSHIFVSEEQADIEYPNAIKYTDLYGVRYYVLQEDLENGDLYVIDEKGVRDGKNIENSEVLYINTNIISRVLNMRKRGDSFKSIIIRLIKDKSRDKIKIKYDHVFKNSDELYKYISEGIEL